MDNQTNHQEVLVNGEPINGVLSIHSNPKTHSAATSINATDILSEAKKLTSTEILQEEHQGLLIVKPANDWINQAKIRPTPKMLFSEFWFEGELCILFADTNTGKSILAVQIANSISTGRSIPGFRLECEKQNVLYCDFELSDKQFENRYSNEFSNHYHFNDNFYRIEINPDAETSLDQSFEEYLNQSLELVLQSTQAKILIIDNITYLTRETEKAKDALPLMKKLKALKAKYNLSILALAHTPKRDLSKPITRNDLQGSKMLINFCDAAFSIGESFKDKYLRYLKQIKARNTEIIYDTGNVILCQINKPDNFLMFEMLGFGTERDHLKHFTAKDEEIQLDKVLALHEQGKSLREIGSELNISHMKVRRILKKNQ
ncbi:AAA family ATPase [Candidatus Nomurabacteria bacterium]|nr:AAA family ATPase [Candidatus Nomurabacteria bacterium]